MAKCKTCSERIEGVAFVANLKSYCDSECAFKGAMSHVRSKRVDKNLSAWKNMQDKPKRLYKKSEDKSVKELLPEVQILVNKLVRLRDKDLGCLTCDKPSTWSGQWHAAHFYSVGGSSNLRFHLDNISKCCAGCNAYDTARHHKAYRPALIKKIGIERVEWLDANAKTVRRYEHTELLELMKQTREEIKKTDEE